MTLALFVTNVSARVNVTLKHTDYTRLQIHQKIKMLFPGVLGQFQVMPDKNTKNVSQATGFEPVRA